jgi:hypothetical protein
MQQQQMYQEEIGYCRCAYYIGRRGRSSLVDSSTCAALDFGVCWCVCVRVWDGGQRDAEELVELLKTLSIDVFFEFFKAVSMLVPD